MVRGKTGGGVFGSVVVAVAALALVACGKVTRTDGERETGPGGSGGSSGATGSGGNGDSSGATGGARAGSNGAAGTMGGSAATAGSGGNAGVANDGSAGDGSAGEGSAGEGSAGEPSVRFYWIEGSPEHLARAAASVKPASLRILTGGPYDAPAIIATSELHIGSGSEEVYTEAIVWTEATGTTGLGGLPGVTSGSFTPLSVPKAVSADGSVVVGVARNLQLRYSAFRWTRADGMEALGGEGGAVAVSADGSVVVGVQYQPVYGVFRWTRATGAMTIVEPLPGDDQVVVLALSADGATVLGESARSDGTASRLFVWKAGVGTRAIENLPGYASCQTEGDTLSRVRGFVADGECFSDAKYEPFVWAGQDKLLGLGSAAALDPGDALGVYAPGSPVAITADGSVAIGTAGRGAHDARSYRWTKANGLAFIELPAGYTSDLLTSESQPVAMSEDGSVVVGRMQGTASLAFLWSASAGAVVLSPLEGDTVTDVTAVSADGSVAAGTSRYQNAFPTSVYWRADGVPHRITDELAAGGIELGSRALFEPRFAQTPLGFFGVGSKDEVSIELPWRARLR